MTTVIKDLINYLHAACFSPVKSTWITAIKNGNVSSWPGLTEHAVEKHLSKSISTTKVHLNQQRQNARTTKIKDAKVIVTEHDLDHGVKTQFVYHSITSLAAYKVPYNEYLERKGKDITL
jgi:hypothetical protein